MRQDRHYGQRQNYSLDSPDHMIDELVGNRFERLKQVKAANLEDVYTINRP